MDRQDISTRTDKKRRGCASGFTLVEMLIVIAIIGILAALLMPALDKALQSSRMINCLNNLSKQGIAFGTYVNDYNSFMPFRPGKHDSARLHGRYGSTYEWLLFPYLGISGNRPAWGDNSYPDNVNSPLFWCPSGKVVGKRSWGLSYRTGGFGLDNDYRGGLEPHFTRNANFDAVGATQAAVGNYPVISTLRVTFWSRPARVPYQFCSNQLGNSGDSWHFQYSTWNRPTLFVDGHVKALSDPFYTAGSLNNAVPQGQLQYGSWGNSYGVYSGTPAIGRKRWDMWIEEY